MDIPHVVGPARRHRVHRRRFERDRGRRADSLAVRRWPTGEQCDYRRAGVGHERKRNDHERERGRYRSVHRSTDFRGRSAGASRRNRICDGEQRRDADIRPAGVGQRKGARRRRWVYHAGDFGHHRVAYRSYPEGRVGHAVRSVGPAGPDDRDYGRRRGDSAGHGHHPAGG